MVLWLAENQNVLIAIAVGILVVAGGWGYMSTVEQETTDQADTALSEVQNGYRLAMGAAPGSVSIPEPANPEAAREIRADYTARYAAVGEAYAGSGPGAVAFLEAGKLQQTLGDIDAAIAAYRAGIDSLPEKEALRGFLWSRMGSAYEQAQQWEAAAEAYAKAGELQNYALHAGAQADAIRAYIHAGETRAALSAAEALGRAQPDFSLPEFLQAQLDELRIAAVNN